MFPTAGYFRSTNCPFFVHGLCHRPYCHFRHSKPGLKASKSKISPHKHNTEKERHAVIKTKTPSLEGSDKHEVQAAVTVTTPKDKTKKTQTAQDTTSYSNEEKYTTSATTTTTTIKSILKKTNEEISVDNQLSSVEESVHNLDQKQAIASSHVTNNSSLIETFDADDTEQPFASLTDEEMKIIGLTACPSSVNSHDSNLTTVEKTDLKKSPVSNSSSHSNTSASTKLLETDADEYKGAVSSNHGDINTTDAHKEAKMEQVKMGGSNEKLLDTNYKGVEDADGMQVDSGLDCVGEKHNLTITKERSGKSDVKSRKRKSVQLQTSAEGSQDKTRLLHVVAKKRKSQQLPSGTTCSSHDLHAVKIEEDNKVIKKNESGTNQDTTLHQFFMSTSKSLEESDHSRKSMLSSSSEDIKRHKAVFGSPVKLKDKSPVKQLTKGNFQIPKKKAIVSAEAEINFFGPKKKAVKIEKTEQQEAEINLFASPNKKVIKTEKTEIKQKRSKEKTKTLKASKLERRRLEKNKSLRKTEPKTTPITIFSSDESDMCSPSNNWGSSTEEDNCLMRIWNDYELPQNDDVLEEDLQSPIKNQTQELPTRRRLSSTSTEYGVEKPHTLVNTLGLGGLGKKPRVAHASNQLPRRLSSNANPVRRYPKTLSAVQKKEPVSLPESLQESSVKASVSYKPAKQRVAHVLKNKTPAGSLPRPRILVEYGAKVPQSQRQRYLDRIVDEYLRICPTEKDAFEKAVEEESALYERSTRRQVYMNLCVNAIKKLRDMTPLELSSPDKTVTRVAVTRTLSSGAVVISTKSPVKQEKPAIPESDQFTEEVMYDFLSKYLMSEEDLVENCYPRPCPTAPWKAVFKTRKEQPSKDSSRRICCRCGKPFALEDGKYVTKEECIYHAGKLFRKRGEPITNYSCCQGDAGSPGCCVGKVHVSDNVYNTDGFMTTIVSPLTDQRKKIFSMDCEMCYTTSGLELTRITVVNWNLEGVYDTFVVPERTIVDYNTRFSGVTEELLRGVTTTIHEVQAVLLSMIHKDTILVGHSLESDLKATKLIHSKVVDTSVVFPHRLGPPYKRALRNLMAEHLKKIIQDSIDGHDSHEDAAACLELMRWKVKEDMKKTSRHRSPRHAL